MNDGQKDLEVKPPKRKLFRNLCLIILIFVFITILSILAKSGRLAQFISPKMESILGWERLNTGLIDTETKNIILTSQPSTIYLQTNQSFFKSTDNGLSWIEIKTLPGNRKNVFITSYESSYTGEHSDTLWLGTSTSLEKDEEGQNIRISPLFTSNDGARTWKEVTLSCLPKKDTRNYMNYIWVEGIFFDNPGNIYLQVAGRLGDKKPFIMLLTRSKDYEYDYDCRDIGKNVFNDIEDGTRDIFVGGFGELVRPGFFGFFSDYNDTYAISGKNIYYNPENSDKWEKIQKPSDKFIFFAATSSIDNLIVTGNDDNPTLIDGKIGDKIYLRKGKSNSWENITGDLPEVYVYGVKAHRVSDGKNYSRLRIFVIGKSFYNVQKKTNNKRGSGEIYILTTDINIDNVQGNIKWNDITGDLNETFRVRGIADIEIQDKNILLGTREQGLIRGIIYKKNKLK